MVFPGKNEPYFMSSEIGILISILLKYGDSEKIESLRSLIKEIKDDVESKLMKKALDTPLTPKEATFIKHVYTNKKRPRLEIEEPEVPTLSSLIEKLQSIKF